MTKLKAIFFDLDGTVTDSAEIVAEAMQAMYLAQTGKELPITDFYKYLGPPLSWSFANLGASPEEMNTWLADYRKRYLQKMPLTPLFPGIKELLAQLSEKGFQLAVATSKNTKYAIEVCTYTDVSKYFREIFGADDSGCLGTKALVVESAIKGFVRRGIIPAEAKRDATGFREDVIMVGDRIHDIEGAGKHHIRTILVGWGKAPATEREKAWAIAENPADLLALLLNFSEKN